MDFLFGDVMGKPLWMWASFIGLVVALLAFDLGVLHRTSREIPIRESLVLSAIYIGLALLYGAWIWATLGAQSGSEYFTGYLVEKTLSMDNVFVMSLIFTFFAIPKAYQHRVLFWGILGVIVLRAIMIGLGAALVAQFHWVLYVFAAFLVFTGIKMLVARDHAPDLARNPVLLVLRRHFNVTDSLHHGRFFVTGPHPVHGRETRWVTPLFVALILIECVDLVFAVDSIPAIFAITTDPFIVYTSNIFAILGLRALYFALAAMVDRFKYLKQALALVLIFIGSKVVIADVFGLAKFPAAVSLTVTLGLIAGGVVFSLYRTRQPGDAAVR
jgi:tellurite resistance protein TerC